MSDSTDVVIAGETVQDDEFRVLLQMCNEMDEQEVVNEFFKLFSLKATLNRYTVDKAGNNVWTCELKPHEAHTVDPDIARVAKTYNAELIEKNGVFKTPGQAMFMFWVFISSYLPDEKVSALVELINSIDDEKPTIH